MIKSGGCGSGWSYARVIDMEKDLFGESSVEEDSSDDEVKTKRDEVLN